MSDEDQKKMRIENLVHRLNNMSIQRRQKMDELWVMEEAAELLREELVALVSEVA